VIWMSEVEKCFKCRWCPCVFSTEADLASHLKAFGDRDHLGVWSDLHGRYDRSRND
jgi:hypothetical protein